METRKQWNSIIKKWEKITVNLGLYTQLTFKDNKTVNLQVNLNKYWLYKTRTKIITKQIHKSKRKRKGIGDGRMERRMDEGFSVAAIREMQSHPKGGVASAEVQYTES